RGLICGAMTTLGGIGHTLPFLIKDFPLALGIAIAVVLVELGVITLGASPVHGYANVLRSSAGGTWRSTRVHYGCTHWKIVCTARGAEPVGPAGNSKLGSRIGTVVGRKRGRIRIS